jgi:hypothetical protein
MNAVQQACTLLLGGQARRRVQPAHKKQGREGVVKQIKSSHGDKVLTVSSAVPARLGLEAAALARPEAA